MHTPASRASLTEGYFQATDWSPLASSELNTSVFVFRDRNGNGAHDSGERPFAGVIVRLLRPDSTVVERRTNPYGFANFSNSIRGLGTDISVAGVYHVEVVPPPGSARRGGQFLRQAVRFDPDPNSRAGIRADVPPVAVGLAPDLRLAGRWPPGVDSIWARLGADTVVLSRGAAAPDFALSVSPGVIDLRAVDRTGRIVGSVRVRVSDTPVRLAWDPSAAERPGTEADTIRFDPDPPSLLAKFQGTGNLRASNVVAVHYQAYGGEGYVNGATSPPHVAYGSSGYPLVFTGKEPFHVVSLYLSTAWHSAEGDTATVRGWRDGALVAEEVLVLSSLHPVQLRVRWLPVDRLEVASSHQWPVVIDDLVIRN